MATKAPAKLYIYTALPKDSPGASVLIAAGSRAEAEALASRVFDAPPTTITIRTYRLPDTQEQLMVYSVQRMPALPAHATCDTAIDDLPPCTNKPMRNWTTCNAHRSFGRSTVSDERGGNYTPPNPPLPRKTKRLAARRRAES